jgi:quinoprotein glucose dehydrogenase
MGVAETETDSGFWPRPTLGLFRLWLDSEGYPAIKPPWGTLNAVELNTGEIKWKVVLGEYPELTARGIPPTGTENYGGPLVTAGGLIFIGATADETFRAFDKKTGEILWKTKLPFGGNASPCTYTANGRQNSGGVCFAGLKGSERTVKWKIACCWDLSTRRSTI